MMIALVSLNQAWEDKIENQQKCKGYVKKASELNSDLIIFPEMTLTGFSMKTHNIKEKQDQSSTIEFFREQAVKNRISIAFGVVLEKKDKATNNLIVIDNTGNLLSSYIKIHPFSFSGENNYYFGGNELVTCQIADATIGLTICYDLRFPEIFQALSKKCNLLLNIANWPERRIKHWNVLLEARAIENQTFMIGVNRTGKDDDNITYIKSSAIFDPLGEKVLPTLTISDMDIYVVNLNYVISARNAFPIEQDRKAKFYKSIL